MTYEIRYHYRFIDIFSGAHPWRLRTVKRTRHWCRVRIAAWLDAIYRMFPSGPPNSSILMERKMRVRIIA